LGAFPPGWAEWNDRFRDAFRKSQNKLGILPVTPADLAKRFAGSSPESNHDGRRPSASINFIVAHDGVSLCDLYSYNERQMTRPFPFGPSDGGRSAGDEMIWDQGGHSSLQRQAARNGIVFLMLSSGTPMITGGTELYRTQFGNNNTYNLDTRANWLNWSNLNDQTDKRFFGFTRRLVHFRLDHPALRPAGFFSGSDHNGNGLKDISWYRETGKEPDGSYWDNADNHFLAYRIDGTECGDSAPSIYVGYNGWKDEVAVTLPTNLAGKKWYRVADTAAWMEDQENSKNPGQEDPLPEGPYGMKGRSILLLIEK
jgi:glycogen operon protein